MKTEWPLRPLGEIADLSSPRVAIDPHADYPFVGMADIDQETGLGCTYRMVPGRELKSKNKFLPGDILFARITPCVQNGKIALGPEIETPVGFATTEVFRIGPREGIDRRYLLHFLRSPRVRAAAEANMTGTTNRRRVPREFLVELPVPVPPLDEQRRIAGKLDAALSLLSAVSSHLTESGNLISMLGASYLRRAMPKPGERLAQGEWVSLDQICSRLGGVWGPEAAAESAGFPVVRSTEIRGFSIDASGASIRVVPKGKIERFRLRAGDILVNKSSGSAHLVGWPAIFEDPQDDRIYLFSNFMIRLRFDERVNPRFALYYLHSPQARALYLQAQTTTSGLRNLKTSEFMAQPFPLLPRDRQDSLVATIDQLFDRVRTLESLQKQVRERVGAGRHVTLELMERV